MKKILPLFLIFLVGCSSVQSLPNVNEKLDVKYSDEKDILSSSLIYEGVTIEGTDVSGTNLQSVKPIIQDKLDAKLDQEVKLTYEDKEFKYTLRDLGYYIDLEQTAKKALAVGRDGTDEERLAYIKDIKKNPVDVLAEVNLQEASMNGIIDKIADDIYVRPVNPEYKYDWDNDKVIAEEGQTGYNVDKDKLKESLVKAIEDKSYEIEIPVNVVKAVENAQEQAARVNGVIGYGESNFRTGFWERIENIRVSTEALDGVVLAPGETFSFNDYIGDTTYDKGYQMAVVIDENNNQVDGMGGGVCQTSTCLYHAVLRSDLQIINRVPHTQYMSYSPGGLDAAIEYGSADLAFRNDFDFPILIRSYYEPGYIQFKIYGDTNVKNYDVSIFSEQIGSNSYSAYKKNEGTGEVIYLGDTIYPPSGN